MNIGSIPGWDYGEITFLYWVNIAHGFDPGMDLDYGEITFLYWVNIAHGFDPGMDLDYGEITDFSFY